MTPDLAESLENLYTAVVADVLDQLGHREQTLSAEIRALTPNRRACGRAFTARAETVDRIPKKPYELEMAAVDRMASGDLLVVDAGHHRGAAFWGELLSTACLAKGVRGIVMSACTRDLWALSEMSFPVFGIGCTPADSKGRLDVVSIGDPVEIDGVTIATGDWILADMDGVVVIPQSCAEEVARLAAEKMSGENTVRDELAAGVPVARVFEKHGIL